MSHPHYHAKSSAKKFGGCQEDYYKIHAWFDQTKAHIADARHRALLHSSFGIFLCEQVFGSVITNSEGKEVPVRVIGEQHVMEDMGFIPSIEKWFETFESAPWMSKGARRLSDEFQEAPKLET